MKCLILAAGYATRLYPLTMDFPKPLLEVGGKPILNWLIEDIGNAAEEFIVISNHRFAGHFRRWAEDRPFPIRVLDDGTETNETRLGAVRDILFAVDEVHPEGDLLVIAGDNLLDFSLRPFLDYAHRTGTSCVMRYWEEDIARLRKAGVARVNGENRILEMEEKPTDPKSHWCIPPFYYYRAEDAGLVKASIEAGCGVDAPGSLLAWLSGMTAVHAWDMPGHRYDIGNLASYEKVKKEYAGIPVPEAKRDETDP
jgi:glucose-1-phosphate thymidylyltransferase